MILKFRVWDLDNKKMIGTWEINEFPNLQSDEKYKVMQFSNFYDKHKNEIYEGDIIELVNEAGKKIKVVCEFGTVEREIMGGRLNLCVINGFSFCIVGNGKHTYPISKNYLGVCDTEIFEVIGNIYENKNLV